jgi:amidase
VTVPVDRPAVELAALLRDRQLSSVELTEACLARIEAVNPAVNAVVTLVPERARAAAAESDARRAAGAPLGPLDGLPMLHKDSVETAGVRTTSGSPLFADHVPEADSLPAARLRSAGTVLLGKTNLPEFGAGSQTFNPVFGPTRNPYAPAMTVGGSSGGSAAALACGMAPLADGSDMGGSLRNPASFCGVVGLRPTPGRVPAWPASDPWDPLSVDGPLGRTVPDVALLLSAQAGPHPAAPLSLRQAGSNFLEIPQVDMHGLRIAFSPALGDLPVERSVAEVTERSVAVLAEIGCLVTREDPDLKGADEAFETLRALAFERDLGELADEHPQGLKQTIRWNIEQGRLLSGADVARAQAGRARLLERWHAFMTRHAYLVTVVSQLPPFPVELEWPAELAGRPMSTYIEWMRSCSRISVTGSPALAVPAGFTGEGLPVGIQIVGRPGDDAGVLAVGLAFEQAMGPRRPPAVR